MKKIDDFIMAIVIFLVSQWKTGLCGMSFDQAKRIAREWKYE